MTGHNARRPRTGRERRPWWPPSEASYLTVWTLNDRFFASRVHCILRRVLSEYWRKETEKSKVFWWGGRFGRSLLCPGRAEKKTRGSCPPTGCLPVDRNKLGPDSWRDERGVCDRTDTHTHRDTEWKSLRLDLLEVDRMTALIHYERQRWKKVNFFAKKPLHRSLFQHVQTLCMPSFIDLHTHATPGHVTSFACSRNTSDRSLAYCSHHGRRSTRAIEVKHETLQANRTRLLAAPVDLLPVLAVDLLACSRRRHCSPTRDGHQPVMTGHNARRPRTGRERRPWWWPSEASYLTVWRLNDRFFASLVHCMLRRLLSEYWRKETEKSKVFRGVVGLDGRCSAQAEQRKNPWQLATYRVLTCRQKQTWSRFVAWWKRSLIPDTQTRRHTHTHTRN